MTGLKRSLDESGSPHDAGDANGPAPSPPVVKGASPSVSSGTGTNAGSGGGAAASSFRNVSACNRCRLRKNRCDQSLPSCATCDKAGVKCVGYDPITKREIPRRCVASSPLFDPIHPHTCNGCSIVPQQVQQSNESPVMSTT